MKYTILILTLCSSNVYAFGDLEILNDFGLGKIREIAKTTEIVTRQIGGRVPANNSSRYNRVYGNIKRLPIDVKRRNSIRNIPDTIQDVQNIFKELL